MATPYSWHVSAKMYMKDKLKKEETLPMDFTGLPMRGYIRYN
ncbi:hypothetical protein N9P97_00835 [Saprospiraceae bacterium]|nr:hypothetical protein [Saprospiraceae bacterium]